MIAVILAGGSGTRFWPLSRQARPKQLIALFGDEPMVAHTVERVRDIADDVLVVVGESLLEATRAVLDLSDESYVVEPAARNTAPAIGLAAIVSLARHGDEPVVVLPSDHFIADVAGFRERLRAAETLAADGWIVTLGITPTRPETGYGYIRFDAETELPGGGHPVRQFVEKPDVATALAYLGSGRYAWNAGIFVFRPSVMLAELKRQRPAMHAGLETIGAAIGTDDYARVVREVFGELERVSIDYAVMEGASKVAVVPADVGWSDVGHWSALDSVRDPDAAGNVVVGDGVLIDVSDSVVFDATGRGVTAVVGLDGIVVVRTEDAVLVLPRDQAQRVRDVVAELERRGAPQT